MKRFLSFLLLVIVGMFSFSGCAPHLQPTQPDLHAQQQEITDRLYQLTELALQEAKKDFLDDPSSPSKKYIPKLKETLEYATQVKSGQTPYDPNEILRRVQEVREMGTNIARGVTEVLENDVSFAIGKYEITDLLEGADKVLHQSVNDVMAFSLEFQKKFPHEPIIIAIKTIGYADEVPPGEQLAATLIHTMKAPMPSEPVTRRQLLNQELSRKRAETISNFIQQHLQERIKLLRIRLAPVVIIGYGEEYPYAQDKVSPPYQKEDERRRICKIYGSVYTQAFYNNYPDVRK